MAVEKTGLDSALASLRHTYPQASPNEGTTIPVYTYLMICKADTSPLITHHLIQSSTRL